MFKKYYTVKYTFKTQNSGYLTNCLVVSIGLFQNPVKVYEKAYTELRKILKKGSFTISGIDRIR